MVNQSGSGVKDAKDNNSGADATENNSGISTTIFLTTNHTLMSYVRTPSYPQVDFHITSLNVLFDAVQRIAPLGVLANIVIVINLLSEL